MKKINFSFLITLVIFLQPQSFSGENDTGLDMNAYASWAGYFFLILLAFFFLYFLSHASDETVNIQPINSTIIEAKTAATSAPSEVFTLLKYVNYLIISLLLLYVIIITLLIV